MKVTLILDKLEIYARNYHMVLESFVWTILIIFYLMGHNFCLILGIVLFLSLLFWNNYELIIKIPKNIKLESRFRKLIRKG